MSDNKDYSEYGSFDSEYINKAINIEISNLYVDFDKLKPITFVNNKHYYEPGKSVSLELNNAAYNLPGVREIVKYPCTRNDGCEGLKDVDVTLMHAIMNLNDFCKWTREEIADWLETLDIDMTFQTPTERPKLI